jgi:hypothetical protein
MATEKFKASLYIDQPKWQAFREACLRRRITASSVLSQYIDRQLMEWQKEGALQPPIPTPQRP